MLQVLRSVSGITSVTIITKSQVTPPNVTNISKIEDHSLICFTFATGGS